MSKDFSTWYGILEVNKVQCKACKCVFARKHSRMLSHLGSAGPIGNHDRGISLCSQLTSRMKLCSLQWVIPKKAYHGQSGWQQHANVYERSIE